MSLLHRHQPQPGAAPAFIPQPAYQPQPMMGTLQCSSPGCQNQTGVQCAYVDRRGRPCNTAWCPEHQAMMNGAPYCRRHARLHGAIPAGSFLADRGLPDVDNRAPSLVNWIGDALDPSLMALLESLRRPGTADEVGTEPVHHVRPADGRLRWDRAWKLFDHTGILAKVTVEIEEARDPEVDVRVGRQLVVSTVPPWIARRRRGEPALDEAADHAEREQFYRDIYEKIVPLVVSEVGRTR